METLFFIMFSLVLLHYIYESMIAPSLRHSLRYKFFKLRDELREEGQNKHSKDEAYLLELFDNIICDMISSMRFINMKNYFYLKKHSDKKEIKGSVKEVQEMIDKTDNPVLKKVNKEITELGANALMINNGGIIPYLVVLYLVYVIFKAPYNIISSLKKISSRLIYNSSKFEKKYYSEDFAY